MDTTLVARGERVRFRVVGTALETTTYPATGPMIAVVEHATDAAARDAFYWAVRDAMERDGFAMLATNPAPGDVMFETFAPRGAESIVFDMSLDGKWLVGVPLGRTISHYSAKGTVIEVATGDRRVVIDEPRTTHCFVVAALFDRTASAVYFQLHDGIVRVDLATGERRRIATGRGYDAHVVRPSFDRARRRLVVYDDATVRVLEDERSILDIATECRGVAISPSGRLLAVHIGDAVLIWDIEARALLETMTIDRELTDFGISHTDDTLVVNFKPLEGPIGLAIPSGEVRWKYPMIAYSASWAYSPDGSKLAIAGLGLRVFDATTREEILVVTEHGRIGDPIWSADGSRLAASINEVATIIRIT